MSSFEDKTLTCKDCGQQFVWTIAEQEFYQSRGFLNAPVRCPNCRAEKKRRMGDSRRGPREMFEITCEQCGKTDTVPFKPKGDRPVYCADCFRKQKEQSGSQEQSQPEVQEESAGQNIPKEQEIPMEQELPSEEKAA